MLKRLVNDVGTILLALILAVVVWIVAVQEENPVESGEFPESIPIEVLNQPPGTTFLPERFNESVYVTVQAPQSSWRDLRADKFTAWIDLEGHDVGEYEVPVQAECIDEDVRITGLRPAKVPVRLRKEVSRTVPVEINLFGSPGLGYEFRPGVIQPLTVTVTGAESLIDEVAKATVNLDLRDRRETFVGTRRVDARRIDDEIVSFVRIEPPSVQITIPVEQKIGTHEVAVRAVTTGTVAAGYWVQGIIVEPPIVTLIGDPKVVGELAGSVETLALNIDGATGDVVERLPLDLPEQVSPVAVQGVKVTVQIAALRGNVTLVREPVIRGLGANLEATVSPSEVAVTLSGPLPRIRALTDEDVFVYVDLVDKDVGEHRVQLTSLVPEGLEVVAILPEYVDVEIRREQPTPTPTFTPTPTATPTPTSTLTGTQTLTGTVGITATMTATVTVTGTPGVGVTSPIAQGTPTPILTPPTPTPTATPTKERN